MPNLSLVFNPLHHGFAHRISKNRREEDTNPSSVVNSKHRPRSKHAKETQREEEEEVVTQ
jgi:hypothetical protein